MAIINGFSISEELPGTSNDDTIQGFQGDDTIIGGGGTDTAVFSGPQANYTITSTGGNNYTVSDNVGTDGTDTLIDIQNVQFSDSSVWLFGIDLSSLNGSNGFRMDGIVEDEELGTSVSGAGDVNGDGFDDFLIGAPYAMPGGFEFGSTFLVFGRDNPYPALLDLYALSGSNGVRFDGESIFGEFGDSVSGAGDVNGDGIADIFIGASDASVNGDGSGAGYIFFGKAGPFAATVDASTLNGSNGFRIEGVATGDEAGTSVASAGDINGDGVDDLIIGAPLADSSGAESGSSYVVFGKSTGFTASLNLASLNGTNGFRLNGIAAEDESGTSVSGAGDINNDGFDDLIVGVPLADNNGDESGSAYVIFGKAGGYTPTLDLTSLNGTTGFRLDGLASTDLFGSFLSGAGDINGDGFDDLIIGAPFADPNGSRSGSSYVIYGSSENFAPIFDLATLNGSNGFRIDGSENGDAAGVSVNSAGDFNGDGVDDLILSAAYASPGGVDFAGSTFVVFGNSRGFASTVELGNLDAGSGLQFAGKEEGDLFGFSANGAGDVNNDGYDDIIIGASLADPNADDSGSSFFIFGRPTPTINHAPAGLVLIAGDPKVGEVLTAFNTLTDSDGGIDSTISYEWKADEVAFSSGTANAVVLTGAEAGKTITVTAHYIDGFGTAESAQSAATGIVQNVSNSLPTGDVFYIGKASVGETLVAQNTLADQDGLGPISYQWLVDNVAVPGAATSSFELTQDELGKSIRVRASFTDGAGTPEAVTSDPATPVANENTVFNLSDLDGSTGFQLNGNAALDNTGFSLSGAGDVNGDGFDDLIISSFAADNNGDISGSVHVVFGTGSGFSSALNLDDLSGSDGFRIDGAAESDRIGISVSGAGDFNGDGFDDLIIGAPDATNSSNDSGSSYVLFGKESGYSRSVSVAELDGDNGFRIDDSSSTETGTGISVGSAGDVNGDGYGDLAIGSWLADINGESSGSGYIVFGKAGANPAVVNLNSLDGNNGFRLDGEAAFDYSGYSVSSAGDVNGDGFDDVLIGAFGADPNGSDSGATFVIFGKATGFAAATDLSSLDGVNGFRLNGADAGDSAGLSVSSAGDVNKDGFDDLVIGALLADPDRTDAGSTYLFFGKAGGYDPNLELEDLDGTTGVRFDGVDTGDESGVSVSGAGDVNNDGFDDIIIGANFASPNGSGSGASYVVFGSDEPFAAVVNLTEIDSDSGYRLDGVAAEDNTGIAVSGAGDFNGDGYDDLLVGAPNARGRIDESGAGYLIFGSMDPLQHVVEGTSGNDVLRGEIGKDTIRALGGKDTLEGQAGNDVLEGGDDIDLALYNNDLNAYNIVNDAGDLTVSGPANDGTDKLYDIERLQFDDISLAFDLDGNAGTTVKLLGAVLGAQNWYVREFVGIGLDILDNSTISFEAMMEVAFLAVLGPNPGNAQVVNLLYTSLVGQAPSQQDLNALTADLLDSGALTQGELGVLAANNELNLANIDLVGLTETGVEYVLL